MWAKASDSSSGFSSKKRVNLSPFTKDFRGEEQHNECLTNFLQPSQEGGLQTNVKIVNVSDQSNATYHRMTGPALFAKKRHQF